MEDNNLQEQYALLQEEKRVNMSRTIILCWIFSLIAIISLVTIILSSFSLR